MPTLEELTARVEAIENALRNLLPQPNLPTVRIDPSAPKTLESETVVNGPHPDWSAAPRAASTGPSPSQS
jgi:hypothetical protein